MRFDPEDRIQQVNAQLKASKVDISVQRLGNRLYLRGIPPRLGSTKDRPFRQEIYLGVFFNPAGFTSAENEAKLLGSLLAKREFFGEPYLHPKRSEIICKMV